MAPTGKLMSMPISPLIPLLYYRGDLYKEAGLKAPETFAELEANAKKFHKPPGMYGIVQRGARGPHTVAYDFYPYLYGFGGSIFKDQAAGDYTVTLNNEARAARRSTTTCAWREEAGHPKTASLDQAEVIQNMVTGKAAHIMAWSSPPGRRWTIPTSRPSSTRSSSRRRRTRRAFRPRPGLGHWLGGIAKNVPDDRKRGAVEFLRWFQTKEAQLATAKVGGIPVSAARLSRSDRGGAQVPLDEAARRVAAACRQHLSVPGGERGHRHPRARPQPGDRRRDRQRRRRSTAWRTRSTRVMAKYGYKTGKLPAAALRTAMDASRRAHRQSRASAAGARRSAYGAR